MGREKVPLEKKKWPFYFLIFFLLVEEPKSLLIFTIDIDIIIDD